ncbi:dephospho-CoA kinase [Williamsoniiplasma lucivorax]|uniref:Dephospho-CoA kinase n=1 Tax=Williamsoniiplasma lucivorax TaxID=209274 RepID=A0A2S5RCW7_9MOLU|nr:dephospho-CoA kinase [Williamsoniiplasma lucivorax]PPE05148.1 dephospho-CoA kinase [Williamsoniiplasma lucivorax]
MIIGIYGFIGSGKTTATNYIVEKYHYQVIDLDEISRQIMHQKASKEFIKTYFNQAYNPEKKDVDRKILREIIFNSPLENQKLSQYMWPKIKAKVGELINSPTKNIIIDGAILPVLKLPLDKYIYIYAHEKELVRRINLRDDANDHTTLELIKYQDFLLNNCPKDFQIENNQNLEDLYRQIDLIMSKISH